MKQWPKNNELISFDDAIEPLIKVLEPVVKVSYDEIELPKYKGYNIGSKELACSFDPEFTFSPKGMDYHHNHGRDVVSVALGVAFQLGIEQGRRTVKEDFRFYLDMLNKVVGL